jgi:hypothetical protein
MLEANDFLGDSRSSGSSVEGIFVGTSSFAGLKKDEMMRAAFDEPVGVDMM